MTIETYDRATDSWRIDYILCDSQAATVRTPAADLPFADEAAETVREVAQ